MLFDKLNNDNLIFYASRHYDNPQCNDVSEFQEDLDRIKYIKRLLRKYVRHGILKERLLLNHLITFHNVFGNEATLRILFYKMEPDLYEILKSFLLYLNYLPNVTYIEDVDVSQIEVDTYVLKKLSNI